jgi:parvulin-like peptidyl-prolyl isomerase
MTNLDDQQDDVIEAEVVSDGEHADVDSSPAVNAAAAMLNLEELIKNHIDSLDKLRNEMKEQREMYEDSFNNNPTYREHVEKVKEATKGRSQVRQQIAKQPSVAVLDQKIKDMRFDIKEKQQTLSDLLADYKEQTGATSIETRNGQVLEIVSTARLVRKNSR